MSIVFQPPKMTAEEAERLKELWTKEWQRGFTPIVSSGMTIEPSPDLTWAAGLFEGEGCVSISRNRTTKRVSACVKMVDEDVIRRFGDVIGFGRVYPLDPPSRKANHSKQWAWEIYKRAEVKEFCELLLPHMGERRSTKMREALEFIAERERSYAARVCDWCGETFTPYNHPDAVTCSMECSSARWKKHNR